MQTLRRYRSSLGGFMTVLVAVWQIFTPLQLPAATGTWTPTGSGTFNWSSTGNWSGGTVPLAAGDIANVSSNLTGAETINLDVGVSLGSLVFGDSTTTFNPFTIAGPSTLTFDNLGAGATLTHNVSTSTDVISAGVVLADNLALAVGAGTLTFGGPMSGTGNITRTGAGTVVFSGADTWSGSLALNGGTTRFLGTSALPSSNAITLGGTTPTLDLRSDGDATSTPESINFGNNVTVSASGTIIVDRIAAGSGGLFFTPLNKTLQLGDLSIGAQTLTVTNNNGYGLEFTGTTTLTGAATFSVATASIATVVQGLTLSGKVTGSSGFTKTGAGTLSLTNAANDFVGLINITNGVLAAPSDGALGNSSNIVQLASGTGQNATFRATENITTSRTFSLTGTAADLRSFDVNVGKTLELDSAFQATTALAVVEKKGMGTLVLAADNLAAGWTGPLNIRQGIVRITNSNALGDPTASTSWTTLSSAFASVEAALQIDGGLTGLSVAEAWNLGVQSGVNTGGALQSLAGGAANTLTGAITLAGNTFIGADAPTLANPVSVLNLTGGISGAFTLTLVGGGTINISTNPITTSTGLTKGATKFDTGTANLSVASSSFTGNVVVNTGTLAINGAGIIGGTGTIAVNPGGTLALDNATTNVNNRLGGRATTLLGGVLTITGNNSGATTETIGALTVGRGQSTLAITADPTQQANFVAASLARSNQGTIVFSGSGLGSTAGAGVATIAFTAAPTFIGQTGAVGTNSKGILPYALVDSTAGGPGFSFATTDGTASSVIRALLPAEQSTTLVTAANVALSSSGTAGATMSINSLNLSSSSALTINGSQTLTVQSGGLLVNAGTSAINGGGLLTAGSADLIFQTVGGLSVNTAVTGSGGLTKAGAGTLTLSSQNFATGNVNIGQGTLRLNGGTNTLFANQFIVLNGGTLDLNGNAQQILGLLSDSAVAGSAGNVTGNAASTLVVNQDNATRSYAGVMSGGMSFVHSATNNQQFRLSNDNTYTGSTLLTAGVTILQDAGRFSGTSSVDINFATLMLFNNGTQGDGDRVNDAAPIVLRGGTLGFKGRSSAQSTETVGDVTAALGTSVISSAMGDNNGSSIPEATLTLTSLTRNAAAGATMGFAQIYNVPTGTAAGNLGTIGNAERIVVTGGLPVTNNLIGGWAAKAYFFNTSFVEFVGYNPSFGVGALNEVGFAGYDGTAFPAVNQPTQNIRLTTGGTVTSGGSVLNSLNLASNTTSAVALNFVGAGDVLNLTSGGLMVQNVIGTAGATTIGSTVTPGILTAGGINPGAASDLFLYYYANGGATLTVNSQITDNPTDGSSVRLVDWGGIWGNSNVILANGNNTYTGGTVINQNTLTIAATGNLPAGGLTINGGTVTQTAGGIIATQAVTLNGTSTLTLSGNNSLNSITFNNSGGTGNPTVNAGGVLTLTDATAITVTSTNVATVPTITGGTLDIGSATKTFNIGAATANGSNVGPWLTALNIASTITDTGTGVGITKNGNGNLQLSATGSTFDGGIDLNAGGLIVGASSTPTTLTLPTEQPSITSGPLGTGSLRIAGGTRLLSSSAVTINNAVQVNGDFEFGGVNNLTINGFVNLGGNTRTITVTAPQAILTLNGIVSNGGLTKSGYGTLFLGDVNTFAGGITLNNGTLIGQVPVQAGVSSATSGQSPFGSGAINLVDGLLSVRATYDANFNNNINVSSGVVNLDVQSAVATNAVTIRMGNLNVPMSPDPAVSQINLTGGSATTPSTLVLTANSLASNSVGASTTRVAGQYETFNIAASTTLAITNGGFARNNEPLNIGAGTLLLGGNNLFANGTSVTTSITGAAPTNGTTNAVYGTGQTVTLTGTGLLYTIAPQMGAPTVGSLAGATTGGLQQTFANVSAGNLNVAANWGMAPGSVFNGVLPNDYAADRVAYTNANSGLVIYNGYLNITTGGTYSFIVGSDDNGALVIDGVEVARDIGSGHGVQDTARGTIVLAPGEHTITMKINVTTGQPGGGSRLLYSGPDTALTGGNNGYQAIPSSALSYFSGPANAGNNYYNAAQIDNDYVLSAGSTATIQGLGTDFNSTLKSLSLGNSSTLTITNDLGTNGVGGNGFIGITGLTTVGTGVTISPTTANFYLIGGISDSGNGLTKTGAGTLSLNNSSAFTGTFAISAGTVRLFESNALSTGANTVASGASLDLNGVASSSGRNLTISGTGTSSQFGSLYNSSAAAGSLGGNLTLAAASTIAGYGDISVLGTVTASTLLTKAGPDTLTLGANNAATMTGGLAVTAGVVNNGLLNAGTTGSLGGGTVTISAGAAINLNGNNTDRAMTTNGTSISNLGPNQNSFGNIINSSLSSSFSIPFPATAGSAQLKQANTANTATITGNITMSTATLGIGSNTYASGGDIIATGVISGAFALTKVGGDTLYLRGINTFSAGLTVNFGSVILDNGGILNGAGGAITVQPGGSLVLDNTATLTQNRINNGVTANNKNLVLNAGTFTINGNSAATALSETFTTAASNTTGININSGQNYINLVDNAAAGSGGITVTATKTGTGFDFTNANGGTVLITAKNLGINNPGTADSTNIVMGSGSSTAALAMIGQNSNTAGGGSGLNKGIAPFAIVDDGTNVNFAVFDSAAKGIRALGAVTGEYTATNTNALVANDNTLINAATNAVVNANISINSLKLTGGTLTLQQGSVVNIQSGGILATGDATIGGPGIISADGTPAASSTGGSQNVYVHTYGATTNLTLSAALGYASSNSGRFAALIKAGSGNLILSGANFYTGNTLVNEGTLTLANDRAIYYRQTAPASVSNFNSSNTGPTFQVNYGATVNMNGFDLTLDNLNSINPAGNQGSISGGTIINNAAGTKNLTVDTTTNNTWSGNISTGAGDINFSRYGRDTFTITNENTYAGTTTVGGGVTTLVDVGALRGTSAVTINSATLIWNDSGSQADAYRLGLTAADVTFNGGGFSYTGRAGGFTVANLGDVTLASGANQLSTTAGSNGNATTIMTSFTRNPGAVVNFAGSPLGDDGRVMISGAAPTLYNGIVGGWAITNTANAYIVTGAGDFVTYDPATGFRAIVDYKTTSVIDYAGSGLDRPAYGNAVFGANNNIRVNTAGTVTMLAGNNVANSMVIGSAGTTTLAFAATTDTLFMQSGGILGTTDNVAKNLGASVAGGGFITAGNSDGSAGAGNPTYDLYLHNLSNTLTVNAQIVDNGANAVNLITSTGAQNGPVIRLANTNTYTGSTIINSTDLRLASTVGASNANSLNISIVGGTENAADSSRQTMTRILFENAGNQLNAGATVTIVNNATLDTNNFDQTLANIVFNNTGGHTGNSSGIGGSVRSGSGTITLTGSITATNLTNTSTIPFILGALNLNGGQRTVTVDPITGAGVLGAAQVGLSIFAEMSNGGIDKEGTGVLAITGINTYTGATNVNNGTLVLGGRDQQGTPAALTAQLQGSLLNVGVNGTVDMRGGNAFVGSLSGSGSVTNSVYATTVANTGNPATLTIGFDNTTTADFSGRFTNFINGVNETSGFLLNVTKLGTGTQTISGDNASPLSPTGSNGDINNVGTLDIQNGSVVVNGANGSLGFTTINIKAGASLVVDDSVDNKANRLGGYRLTDSANGDVANDTTTVRTINMQGGTLVFKEGSALINEGAAAALAMGTNNGAPTVVLNSGTSTWLFDTSGGAAGATIDVGAMTAGGGSLFINVGGSQTLGRIAAGANSINIYVNGGKSGQGSGVLSAPGTAVTAAAGVQGNVVGGIRPDITASDSTGTGFVTYDTFGYRLLQTNEYSAFPVQPDSPLTTGATTNATNPAANWAAPAPTVGASYTGNAWLNTATAFNTNTTVLSLRLDSGGGLRSAGGSLPPARSSGQTFNALATLNTVTVSSGSIIANAGNAGLSGGAITAGGAALRITAAGDMNVGAYLISTATGTALVKEGAGALTLNKPVFLGSSTDPGQTVVNGGTLNLSSGPNTLTVINTGTTASLADTLTVNAGATVDLTGFDQVVGNLVSADPSVGGGGTVTNSGSMANLFISQPNNSFVTYGGAINGAINLYKTSVAGANPSNLTLTSPSAYTGSTNIQTGVLILQDSATLSSTTYNLNGGRLQADNRTSSLTGIANRIPTSSVLNMRTGAYLELGRPGQDISDTLATVNSVQGYNEIRVDAAAGAFASINITSLNVTPGSQVFFNTGFGTLGNAATNPTISFDNFDTSMTVNGVIPWAVMDTTSDANTATIVMYNPTINPLTGKAYGVSAPNTSAGGFTTPNFQVTAIASAVSGQNLNQTATGTVSEAAAVTTRTFNSLRFSQNTATTLALAPAEVMRLEAGVIIVAQQALTINNGRLTTGVAVDTPTTLYVNPTNQSLTVTSQIVDNGTGALSVVKGGGNTLTLNPSIAAGGSQTGAASNATLAGSTTLTLSAAVTTPPAVGQRVYGPGIANGTTVAAVSSSVITLSTPALATTNGGTFGFGDAQVLTGTNSAVGSGVAGALSITVTPAQAATLYVGATVGGVGIPSGVTIASINTGTGVVTTTSFTSSAAIAANQAFAYSSPQVSTNEAFTGSLVINSTGTLNLSGAAGTRITNGSPITINNGGIVTMNTNAGQIAPTTDLTINGGGVLTYVASANAATGLNALNSLTFNDNGGNVQPKVDIAAGGILTITGGVVTSNSDNQGSVPLINNGTLTFGQISLATTTTASANVNVTDVSGWAVGQTVVGDNIPAGTTILSISGNTLTLSASVPTGATGPISTLNQASGSTGPMTPTLNVTTTTPNKLTPDLQIASVIANSTVGGAGIGGWSNLANGGAPLTKTGNGNLSLTATNTFDNGFVLSEGTVTVGNNAAFGTGPLTIMGGTTLTADSTARTISNSVIIKGDFTFGGEQAGNNLTQNTGTIDLNGGMRNITVTNPTVTATLGGVISNGGLTKSGNGILALTGANTYAGDTVINAGLVTAGNATALGANTNDLTVKAGATLSLTNVSITVDGLNGDDATHGGLITSTGAAPQTLTIGNNNQSSATFAGTITNGAQALNIVKTGTGTQVLNGTNTYTGTTTVNGGVLQVGDNTTGTDATLGSGAVTVNSGGTLAGTGHVLAPSAGNTMTIANGGVLAPGDSAGTSNGNLTLGSIVGNGLAPLAVTTAASSPGSVTGAVNLTVANGGQIQLGITSPTFHSTDITSQIDGGTFVNAATTFAALSTADKQRWDAQTITQLATGKVGVSDVTLASLGLGDTVGGTGNGGLYVGQSVTGTGIANGTTITAINTATKTVTLSQAVTATPTALTIGSTVQNVTVVAGLNSITVADSTGLSVGDLVSGYGIASNVVIASIAGKVITLKDGTSGLASVPLASTSAPTLSFGTSGSYDHLSISGTLTLGTNASGTVKVLDNGYIANAAMGDVFNLLDWATLVTSGTFSAGTNFRVGGTGGGDLDLPNLTADGQLWDVSAFTTRGIIVVVPEPGRAMLLLFGLLALGMRRRRR